MARDMPSAGRRSLRTVILMAVAVVVGAALVVVLLGLVSDQNGSATPGTRAPAPIVFPTTERR